MSETANEIDDAISEYGWRAVRMGLHRLGREPTQAELDDANSRWRAPEACGECGRNHGQLHDDRCAVLRGKCCNCASAAFEYK